MTLHGNKRMRKWLKANKCSMERRKKLALSRGLRHEEATGALLKYMTKQYLKKMTANNMRIYCGCLWLFSGETLITCYPIPKRYHNAVRKCLRRREANG